MHGDRGRLEFFLKMDVGLMELRAHLVGQEVIEPWTEWHRLPEIDSVLQGAPVAELTGDDLQPEQIPLDDRQLFRRHALLPLFKDGGEVVQGGCGSRGEYAN